MAHEHELKHRHRRRNNHHHIRMATIVTTTTLSAHFTTTVSTTTTTSTVPKRDLRLGQDLPTSELFLGLGGRDPFCRLRRSGAPWP